MPPAPGTSESRVASAATSPSNILCFSHLRWNFVYQRPQHLLTRAAAYASVYFFEEPIEEDGTDAVLRVERQAGGVQVLTPLLPRGLSSSQSIEVQRGLVDGWLRDHAISDYLVWYYTPMALLFTDHLDPVATVYDCMDQLSAFQGAPPQLIEQEKRLFAQADVVFTGGRSLFAEKRGHHRNVHLFPSSVDAAHFAAARTPLADPADQAGIAHPRIGFFGVLDERLDRDLLAGIAACEPGWQLVLLGPVVKICEDELPRAANIHYLGQKHYLQLPQYLAHWDVAILPFARNASTRFISPTKTPEYLAAGKPVVSTPIRDVAEPYGELGLARIAATTEEFCTAIQASLEPRPDEWLAAVDEFLGHTSWDRTFEGMWREVTRVASKAAPETAAMTQK